MRDEQKRKAPTENAEIMLSAPKIVYNALNATKIPISCQQKDF